MPRCETCDRSPDALREVYRADGVWVCEFCAGAERAEDAADLRAKDDLYKARVPRGKGWGHLTIDGVRTLCGLRVAWSTLQIPPSQREPINWNQILKCCRAERAEDAADLRAKDDLIEGKERT